MIFKTNFQKGLHLRLLTFTRSAETTEISTFTQLTVYVGILKVHSLLNGTILYASELARTFLLMLCFFLLDV